MSASLWHQCQGYGYKKIQTKLSLYLILVNLVGKSGNKLIEHFISDNCHPWHGGDQFNNSEKNYCENSLSRKHNI